MSENYIKYFYSSYSKAKRLKLDREYLLYLKLKSLPTANLKKGSIIQDIKSITTYSGASISLYIKRLVKCGFISPFTKDGKIMGYTVVSYKKVLKILGVKIRFTGKNKNIAKEHRFNRILINKLKDNKEFKNFIELQDIHNNRKKQIYKARQSILKKIKYHKEKLVDKNKELEYINRTTFTPQDRIKRVNFMKEIEDKKEKIKQLEDQLKSASIKESESFKISCKRFSNLIGYKSIQQGSLLERRSENNKFLIIERSMKVIERNVKYVDYLLMKSIESSLYWMFGNVVDNKCNKLLFTNLFFSFFESNKQNRSSITLTYNT